MDCRPINNTAGAEDQDIQLLTAADLAGLLKVNRSTLYSWLSSGRLPMPLRIGKSVRWAKRIIDRWIEAGCPPRERWQMKG